jgi:hypothetical protein
MILLCSMGLKMLLASALILLYDFARNEMPDGHTDCLNSTRSSFDSI